MAKTKYKLEQYLLAGDNSGQVTEVRIKKDGNSYVLGEDNEVQEADVTAVFRAVVPRAAKAAGQTRTRKKSSARAQAAA